MTDKQEELMQLELDITGTYGSGVTYEDDIVPANIKKRVDDLQEDIFDIDLVFCNDRNEAEAFVYNIASKLEKDLLKG